MRRSLLMSIILPACSVLAALSGYGVSGDVSLDTVNPNLALIAPVGGEHWYMGDTNAILWSAYDSHPSPNSVNIWYSLDGGDTYVPIAMGTSNDGTEPWLVPDVESNAAKIRIQISDNFGNSSIRSSATPFFITAVPPQPPQGLTLDTSNNVDVVLTWQAVTLDMHGDPLAPTGYIILYNETPYDDDLYYYFLGETAGLAYTHYRVLLFRSQMFYKVLAYVDPNGSLARYLDWFKAEPGLKMTLEDLLREFPVFKGGLK
ncbi:MAG: hypothetical protein K0B87_01525 [Candidatus Syntrophosphaera sp.]|nr:hypothetical protein [Candidatus Syntrophosphaera sp.]